MRKSQSHRSQTKNIVFLHGYGFDSAIWQSLHLNLFADYQLFFPDLPGFGHADDPDSYEIVKVAQFVMSQLDTQGIQQCHLVGHSMGGYIALEMIRANPDSYTSLTLLHSHCYEDTPEKKKDRLRKARFIQDGGIDSFLSLFYPSVFKDQKIPETFKSLQEQYASSMRSHVLSGYMESMAQRRDNAGLLERLEIPIHIIHGREDGLIPTEYIFKMATLPSNCTLHILDDAGHMSMFEDPLLAHLLQSLISP